MLVPLPGDSCCVLKRLFPSLTLKQQTIVRHHQFPRDRVIDLPQRAYRLLLRPPI